MQFDNNSEKLNDKPIAVYVKNLNKKRGRSCNRREKRIHCGQSRIIADKLIAVHANKEFKREIKQFEKMVSEAAGRGIHDIPMPEYLANLKETAQLAEGNYTMAHISKSAMDKYPPLTKHI